MKIIQQEKIQMSRPFPLALQLRLEGKNLNFQAFVPRSFPKGDRKVLWKTSQPFMSKSYYDVKT